MVDINESIMKYDFDVTLKQAVNRVVDARHPLHIRETQLNVTCKEDSKMKLIGIECMPTLTIELGTHRAIPYRYPCTDLTL